MYLWIYGVMKQSLACRRDVHHSCLVFRERSLAVRTNTDVVAYLRPGHLSIVYGITLLPLYRQASRLPLITRWGFAQLQSHKHVIRDMDI